MFDTQLEMAKLSWAPVLEYLALVNDKNELETFKPKDESNHIDTGPIIIQYEKEYPKKTIKWLTGRQIKDIHDDMLNTFGGEPGISDDTKLDALIDRAKNSEIFGEDPYKTIIHKAAFLMHSLLRYHQFVDGQKRTGISTAFIFLGLNGYTFWSRDPIQEFHYCIDVAKGKYEVEDITSWIANRIGFRELERKNPNITKIFLPYADGKSLKCTKCQAYLSPTTFRIKCKRCGTEFELRARNVVFNQGICGPQIECRLGLHRRKLISTE